MTFTIKQFDTTSISGVSDEDNIIEAYLGDKLVAVALPTASDTNQFRFEFKNFAGSVVGIEDISFRVQGSLCQPDIAIAVVGYMRRNISIENMLVSYYRSIINYPIVPQHLLNYIGSGEAGQQGYRTIGFAYLYIILKYIAPSPNNHILDIGCGVGRVAMAIAPYLKIDNGRYLGLDTWSEGITWAQENISPIYPMLTFRNLDSLPQGRRKGYLAEYAAPINVDSASIDLVICTSLFTHLKRVAYIKYLSQIFSALKPNGIALITTFLISEIEGVWLRSNKTNDEDKEGLYVSDDTYTDSYLWESLFFGAIRESGLTLCRHLPGSWRKIIPGCTSIYIENFQDVIILKKIS